MKVKNKQFGISMVEVIISAAVLMIIFLGFTTLVNYNARIQYKNEKKIEAVNLASEAIEAIYSIKDENWDDISSLVLGNNYYPLVSGGQWTIGSGIETIGTYSRRVVFSQVLRDANDNISSSGSVDPESYKITSYVQWNDRGAAEQVVLQAYITKWRN